MNTKSAGALLGTATQYQRMQAAELAWWQSYCGGARARERMYALYGMRYQCFWRELETCGATVEFGSGPLPVVLMTRATDAICVDPLMPQYIAAGLVAAGVRWVAAGEEVPDATAETALLLNVLDHTTEPQAVVKDAYRVLRPGGRALVFVHLDNHDDKHVAIWDEDVWTWLREAGFNLAWHRVLDATDYDPRAFVAVAVK